MRKVNWKDLRPSQITRIKFNEWLLSGEPIVVAVTGKAGHLLFPICITPVCNDGTVIKATKRDRKEIARYTRQIKEKTQNLVAL